MAIGRIKLIRTVHVWCDTAGSVTLRLLSDLPTTPIAERETKTIGDTAGRELLKFHFKGTTKGKQLQFELVPTAELKLYRIRAYIRALPGGWKWVDLPVEQTSETYTVRRIPIEPTPDTYNVRRIPIEPTPDTYQARALPIEPTPDTYNVRRMPIEPTPDVYAGRPIPMEETPDLHRWAELEVPL